MVLAENAALSCQQDKTGKWALVARSVGLGKELWQLPLAAEPVRWGLAVDRAGRIVVALQNGRVLCFGRKAGA